MISKIVEMDEKARELNDEALKSKIDYEQEIAVAKQTIIKDYLERARKRVQINAQSERDAAKKELAQTREAHAKIEKKLDDLYGSNCDSWVDEIFKRVISGVILCYRLCLPTLFLLRQGLCMDAD